MTCLIDFADPHVPPGAGPGPQALRAVFADAHQTLCAMALHEVRPLLQEVERLAQAGSWCVGYLAYEAAAAFDPALSSHAGPGPLAWFGVYDQALPWPAPSAAQQHADAQTRVNWAAPLTEAEFSHAVRRIRQHIAQGDCYQVNLTAPWQGQFAGDPLALFERLRRAQPGGYAAYIDTGGEQVLSVSPELFFDWDGGPAGGHILTRPMKGTAPRGGSPQEDTALAHGLTRSAKERAENVMIVDLLRNDLSRIAQPHSVQVPALFAVQSLPTVHQMVSDVTAQTRPGTPLCEVFGALFPCGSITGAPKVRAMQMIHALEPVPRGVYCGAIGVVRPGGHATFNVAIRTVTLRGTQASCGIGSGITADATASAEWQEWQHKRGFLERASEPFALLETLHLAQGKYTNLIAHLHRLEGAARHFGYSFDQNEVNRALRTLTAEAASALEAPQAWRVRLLLQANGRVHAEKYTLNITKAPVVLRLAATYFVASSSEFTRYKTTRRAHYEAFAPTDPAVFDTLLYNAQGELTECTRGNIAVRLDGQWLTPALHCGLLPGVGRADFIAQGRLKEAVITLADLPRAQGWAFVNSLRGWLNAWLVEGRN